MEKLNLSEKEMFEYLENKRKSKAQHEKETFLEYTRKKLCTDKNA